MPNSSTNVKKSGYVKKEDGINHPYHYGGDTVYETIKILEEKLNPIQFTGFCRGNAIKYLTRAGKKDVNIIDDLEKAIFYTKYEIDFRERLETGNIGEKLAILKDKIEVTHEPGGGDGWSKSSGDAYNHYEEDL